MEAINFRLISVITFIKSIASTLIEKTHELKNDVISSIENRELQFNAWFIVLAAVILALAATVSAGLAVWCVTNQHGRFTGNWNWSIKNFKISAECKK